MKKRGIARTSYINYTLYMRRCRIIPFLVFFFFLSFPAVTQTGESVDTSLQSPIDFYIIPILEAAFSGELYWRPDWPDIPPDSFYIQNGNKLRADIELSGTAGNFNVKRDSEGRLVEFPFFLANGYVKVKAEYSASGALQSMKVSFFASGEAVMEGDDPQSSPAEEKNWDIKFPADFFPYSGLSPGGTFPPVSINTGEDFFHVFFFESPAFLSETWYDSEGLMLSFCKALINRKDNLWRIRSLQIYDAAGTRFEDYFFDSDGNITEIRFGDRVFSAQYRNRRPLYWKTAGPSDLRYELQWDTQGLLTRTMVIEGTQDLSVEYRYEYELDADGNWVKRRETAHKSLFGLWAPEPSYSRGIWSRRIVFSLEESNGRF